MLDIFFPHRIQISTRAHPPSSQNELGALSLGFKGPGREDNHSPPSKKTSPSSNVERLGELKQHLHKDTKKGKAVHVTGRGGPLGCKKSRLPHFLDIRLTDGGEGVSFTRRPVAVYPQEDSWYSFLLEAESTPGL
jgi:hypothetical protein